MFRVPTANKPRETWEKTASFTSAHDIAREIHLAHVTQPRELLCTQRNRILSHTLDPGAASVETVHMNAAKLFVVLEGCATILRDTRSEILFEGHQTLVNVGQAHQIINSGKIPLSLIEIRTGGDVGDPQ